MGNDVKAATVGLLLVLCTAGWAWYGHSQESARPPEGASGARHVVAARSEADRLCPGGWDDDNSAGVAMRYKCAALAPPDKSGFMACVDRDVRVQPADVQHALYNGAYFLGEDDLLNLGKLRIQCK